MKTSNKIILFSTLGVVGLFMFTDVLHYINYKRGEILDFAAIEQQDFVSHEEEGIHWLVLDGPMRAFFYPADRLKIDVDHGRAADFHFQRYGDTLKVILNAGWPRGAHYDYRNYNDYAPVHVFFPMLKGIKLINGFAVLDNEESRTVGPVSLELDSTQCWVGNYHEWRDSVYSVEPWDSIYVKGINGNFIVNRQAHVQALDLRLDAQSEFSDRYSRIDTAYIQSDSTTTLHLHGGNLNKFRLHAVVPSP